MVHKICPRPRAMEDTALEKGPITILNFFHKNFFLIIFQNLLTVRHFKSFRFEIAMNENLIIFVQNLHS